MNQLERHSVNVQSLSPSNDASFGESDTFTTIVSNMRCRVIDASATWQVFYAQRHLNITHQVFTSYQPQPTIRAGYKLIWGSKTLLVMGVRDCAGEARVLQIDCQELR